MALLFERLSQQHLKMVKLTSLLLLNHGISVNNTDNDGQKPLRRAASNVHLKVPRDFLSNGGIVHIARKRDLTALLPAADSDQ
jgi:ankyrin repeat protein